MLEELLHDQRLNAGAIGLIMSGVDADKAALPAEKLITRRLGRLLTFDSRIAESQRAMAIVGPRSAGKTTSIAKLGIKIRETFALNVGFISADIFRAGEGFHLQTFSKLAGLPCVARSKHGGSAEIREALESLAQCELVLIDTDSEADSTALEGIECERLLAISAQWSQDEIVAASERYRKFNPQRLVVTQLDRCGYSGPLVQGLLEVAKPVAFFGIGERVPQDVEPAAARRLARMLTRTLQ